MALSKDESIDLKQDLPLHKLFWFIQRVGWIWIFAFLVAAGLGFFGSGGVFAREEIPVSGGQLSYGPYLRWQSPSTLEFQLNPSSVKDGFVEIWFDANYMRQIKIETVMPWPVSTTLQEGKTVYRFLTTGLSPEQRIVFHYQSEVIGKLQGLLGVVGHEDQIKLEQYVYP